MTQKRKVGRPRNFDIDAALETATHVFWEKGYDGASMKDLTEAMGINSPSLYSVFGDKKGLYIQTIQRYMNNDSCAPMDAFESEADMEKAVRAFMKAALDNATQQPSGRLGCFMTNCVSTSVGTVEGSQELLREAIQNAIGSNIANIGLVLGVTAMVRELAFGEATLKREIPWLIGATLLVLVCLLNFRLGVLDGVALLGGLAFLLYRLKATSGGALPDTVQSELDELPDMAMLPAALWFLVGLGVLLLSSHLLVEAATGIAERFHVSPHVIGLTIIAVGTSLPELSVTVTAALRGHADLAIGNVVGSNILNILAVLAIPALLTPQDIAHAVVWRDYGVMMGLTALLVLFAYGIGSRKVVTRFEGSVLAIIWVGYTWLVYYQDHA